MTITLHGIPNCDTGKKARKWLDARGVGYDFHDYKKSPPSADLLQGWVDAVGHEVLLNKRGTTFRKLSDADKADIDDAKAQLDTILDVCGKGHSVGIHTNTPAHAEQLAESIDVVRVLVNQAHTMGNGGSYDNALEFTLSMGGGTWAGNSITENLNARHFMNVTHLVRTIPLDQPPEEELFGAYWKQHGR